ncbi:MAG: glycosyl hydrolase family 18 protein [Cytophagaceae bacterium]
MKKSCILILIVLLFNVDGNSQKIVGYFPSYRDYLVNNVEFNKMTDVIFAFLNFNPNTGALDLSNEAQLNNLITRAKAVNPSIRIHISTGGGAFGIAGFNTLTSNNTARANFVNNIANYIQTRNLDGWDLDWEHPSTNTEKDRHQQLLQEMRVAINAKQAAMCKKLDISIAVSGDLPWASTLINLASINSVDYIIIMAYDSPSYANHSPFVLAENAINGWNAWGVPYNKMLLAVPFYGWNIDRSVAQVYSTIANPAPATVFNSTTDVYNGQYYNAAATLRAKVDLSMRASQKTLGIAIWELGQDRAGQTYSLLDAIYQRFNSVYGLSGQPGNPCTLPVNFTDFTLQNIENGLRLKWSVTGDSDKSSYKVERSYDGNNFQIIGSVQGKYSADKKSEYVFTDYSPFAGVVYYRIKQVSQDGGIVYSDTRSITVSGINYIIYPNPARGVISLECSDKIPGKVRLFLFNHTSLVWSGISESGAGPYRIDFGDLPAGVYFLIMESEYGVHKEKIFIEAN